LTASVQELNGGLALPGVSLDIVPNVVATSQKVFVRAETTNGPPNCLYGVYVSDPRYLAGGSLGFQSNNGVLLVGLGNDATLNADPGLGGSGRTSCPDSVSYTFGDGGVGGPIPDGIQIGDTLEVSGDLTTYCDSYDKQAAACATPIFPEFTVSTVSDLGRSSAVPTASPVAVTDIEDGVSAAVDYAAMFVQVSNVVTVAPNADSNGSIVVQPVGATMQGAAAGLWITPSTVTVSLPETSGQVFSQIAGDLHFITGHWRLQPRLPGDVVAQ
jgi:hypothetical protein